VCYIFQPPPLSTEGITVTKYAVGAANLGDARGKDTRSEDRPTEKF